MNCEGEDMNREEILKMACESGFGSILHAEKDLPRTWVGVEPDRLIRFASLVAAKAAQDEREECALICDQESAEWEGHSDIKAAWVSPSLDDAADKIRARGK